MAQNHKDSGHLSFPTTKGDQASETTETIYKSERPSSIPVPGGGTGRPHNNASPVGTRPRPPSGAHSKGGPTGATAGSTVHHRFLSPAEWARVAHGIGAIKEGETHTVIHPTCWYWPPKGLPDGLYRDLIVQRTKYFYAYHCLSMFRWLLLISQIVLGAILTALGSVNLRDGTPITVLGAINTVDAGLLALMHNSGLPDRYRLNKVEFTKVADFFKVSCYAVWFL